jgi:hypothetical protein
MSIHIIVVPKRIEQKKNAKIVMKYFAVFSRIAKNTQPLPPPVRSRSFFARVSLQGYFTLKGEGIAFLSQFRPILGRQG